jgi:hypothetical protein
MAITIEFRQATDVPCTLIDLKNLETMMDYHSGHNWLLDMEPVEPISEEYSIHTITPLVSEGVFDGTQDDLFCWHVGFCLGMMSGKTIPQAEEE